MQNKLENYIQQVSKPIRDFCLNHINDYEFRKPTHPGNQKFTGGLRLHTIQVIEKALELNQIHDRNEIIECCLVHDVKGCEALPLTEAQRMAIKATKGQADYRIWRPTPFHKFVVLILIADMWSAFINDKNL